MRAIYLLLITLFLLSASGWLVWVAELQSTVIFVIDKGGLYLNYTAGLGRLRVIGFRVRLASGHELRAWRRNIFTGKFVPEDFKEIYHRTTSEHWNSLQIPYRSILHLGIQVIIKELNVNAQIGLKEDAAATAFLCGLFSAVLQAVRAAGSRGRFVPAGRIAIVPVFGVDRLSIRLRCVLAIDVRQVALILAKSLGRMAESKFHKQNPVSS